MSAPESGFDPDTPVEVVYTIKFLSKDEEKAVNFTEILGIAVGMAVSEVQKMFMGDIEVVEDIDLPPTEVMGRDEV